MLSGCFDRSLQLVCNAMIPKRKLLRNGSHDLRSKIPVDKQHIERISFLSPTYDARTVVYSSGRNSEKAGTA